MKGQKILALLGGLAIATSCTAAFAGNDDAKKTSATGKFNEQQAGLTPRGIALDDLFAAFKKKMEANTHIESVASKTPTTAPTAHLQPVHKAPSKVVASQTHKIKSATGASPNRVKPAVYTPSDDDGQTLLAVSSGGAEKPVVVASLDKPGALPKYKAGDKMVVKLQAQQDCNVLVFDYDSKGKLTQLFPNDFEPNGTLKAGSQMELGGSDSKYTLDIGGKGIERIFVYAYPTSEGPITVAMSPVAHTPFRSVDITPDQYRRLVKESRTYFEAPGHDRSVTVMPKGANQQVSTASAPTEKVSNKLELTFQIDK
jgi:hypothetical protein